VVKRKKKQRAMGMEKRGLERREIRREAAAAEEGGAVDMIRMKGCWPLEGQGREGRGEGLAPESKLESLIRHSSEKFWRSFWIHSEISKQV